MSSPAHSTRYSRTSTSPSPPPAPELSEGAASAHFLRLIGQHRPIGAHRHLNVIPVLVALQTQYQEEDVNGESVRERLKELYDVQGLEDLEEIALAPLFGVEAPTPISTPPPDSPRLNSGLQRLPGRTARGSAKPPAREFGLPFAQYEHLVAPRRLDPSAALLESSEGELSEEEEEEEAGEVKEEQTEPQDAQEAEDEENTEAEGRTRKRTRRDVEKRSARGRKATEERGGDEMDEDGEENNDEGEEGDSESEVEGLESQGEGEEAENEEQEEEEDEEEEDQEEDDEEDTTKPKRARRSGASSTARKRRSSGGASRSRKSGGAAKSKTTRASAAKKPRRSTRR